MKQLLPKKLIVILALTTMFQSIDAQTDSYIDSLIQLANSAPNDTNKINVLFEISDNAPDGVWQQYNEVLKVLSTKLMKSKDEKIKQKANVSYAFYLNNAAFDFAEKGNYRLALENYQQGIDVQLQIGDIYGYCLALSSIGAIYDRLNETEKAMEYYLRALEIEEKQGFHDYEIATLNNMAKIYSARGDFQNETKTLKRAEVLIIRYGIKNHVVTTLYNALGTYNLRQGDREQAKKYIQLAYAISDEIHDNLGKSASLIDLARISIADGDLKKGLEQAKLSHEIALLSQSTLRINESAGLLKSIYAMKGEYNLAYRMYETEMEAKDSLNSHENQKALISHRFQTDFDLKQSMLIAEQEKKDAIAQVEMRRQKLVRNGFISGFSVMFLFAGVFLIQRNKINAGKKRSDDLLLNILPEEVAEELKEKGAAEAKLIDHVTVLFTDFKGFTAMSELLSPKDLVNDLNICFSEFDKIMDEHNLEKIKTIGDAYMAAGGLPTPNETHAKDAVNAAFKMRDFVEAGKARKIQAGLPFFEIRIGIHTGPVVAGIVGVKKFQYDIWGDTVNTASRMESAGEIGKVNVSQATYQLLKDDPQFAFENRGKIEAKGKGEMEMWFVSVNT